MIRGQISSGARGRALRELALLCDRLRWRHASVVDLLAEPGRSCADERQSVGRLPPARAACSIGSGHVRRRWRRGWPCARCPINRLLRGPGSGEMFSRQSCHVEWSRGLGGDTGRMRALLRAGHGSFARGPPLGELTSSRFASRPTPSHHPPTPP